MVQIFADEYPDVQSHGGEAAINYCRRNRRRRHRLAATAGVLRTDVTRGWPRAMYKETRRFDMALGHPVELLTHVLADLSQIITALVAGARFRFVAMFDARQMIG